MNQENCSVSQMKDQNLLEDSKKEFQGSESPLQEQIVVDPVDQILDQELCVGKQHTNIQDQEYVDLKKDQVDKEMNDLKQLLEERVKFHNMIVHDLRTPATSIQ